MHTWDTNTPEARFTLTTREEENDIQAHTTHDKEVHFDVEPALLRWFMAAPQHRSKAMALQL